MTTSDLLAAAKAKEALRGQNDVMRALVKVLVVTLLLTLFCTFGLTIAAIHLSRETTVAGAALVTIEGEAVQVASSEWTVVDGELRPRQVPGAADGRRLSGDPQAIVTGKSTNMLSVQPLSDRLLLETDAEGDLDLAVAAEDVEALLEQLARLPETEMLLNFQTGDATIDGTYKADAKRWSAASLSRTGPALQGTMLLPGADEALGEAEWRIVPVDSRSLLTAATDEAEGRELGKRRMRLKVRRNRNRLSRTTSPEANFGMGWLDEDDDEWTGGSYSHVEDGSTAEGADWHVRRRRGKQD